MATVLTAPVIPGYDLEESPDLSDTGVRERLTPAAIHAFVNIARRWKLTEVQARGLLGGIASSTFHAWKTNPKGRCLSQDTLTRISLVIGIFQGLDQYFGEPLADRWVTLGNRAPLFSGRPPIEYMLRQGQMGMVDVRRMLDAWCAGN